jgi:hypothetical protein
LTFQYPCSPLRKGSGGEIHHPIISHFGGICQGVARVFENRQNFSPPPLGSPCRQGEPSLSGSPHAVGETCRQGKPNLCAVPLAKRGEPKGGGQRRHFVFPSRSRGNLKEGGEENTN